MKNRRMNVKIRSERLNLILKWLIYAFLAAIAYVYMTTGKASFSKPLLLIPIALNISMMESEMPASITGLICGFMLDAACGKVFGFNAFLLMTFCMFTSLLFLYLMRQNVINIIIITIVATLLQGVLDFFFFYAMWNYENVGIIFRDNILPSMLFTVIWSVIFYFVIKFVYLKFSAKTEHFIEEKSENKYRE